MPCFPLLLCMATLTHPATRTSKPPLLWLLQAESIDPLFGCMIQYLPTSLGRLATSIFPSTLTSSVEGQYWFPPSPVQPSPCHHGPVAILWIDCNDNKITTKGEGVNEVSFQELALLTLAMQSLAIVQVYLFLGFLSVPWLFFLLK